MKSIKKIIVSAVLLIFTLSIMACQNKSANEQDSNSQISSSLEESTQSSTSSNTNSNELYLSHETASEALYVNFLDSDSSKAQVFCKAVGESYKAVDNELISQLSPTEAMVSLLGLKAGVYSVKVITSSSKQFEIDDLTVNAYDRSGYAHFNYNQGVGAYNDDGTLKENAKVIYVDDATKNSVKLGNYTGIGSILANVQYLNYPICFRIKGRISTRSWDAKDASYTASGTPCRSLDAWSQNSKNADTEAGITDIVGLKDNIFIDVQHYTVSGKERQIDYTLYPQGTEMTTYDSYFNMMEIKNAKNITVEGVGMDAEFFQWGMIFKKCNSIEVRNITFTDYSEDACSVLGDIANPAPYGNFWIHNCVFNRGKNEWEITGPDQRDKADGDGSTDITGCHNVTVAYCTYNNCHKTGLLGGADDQLQFNITFHHNYFYKCQARLPLGRQANMHYYNNYYLSNLSCMDLRATAYAFSEANLFENCTSTIKVTNAVCKSFGDRFIASAKISATIVTTREQAVTNTCQYGQFFDTDSKNFYYDAVKNKTVVSYLTAAIDTKNDCLKYSKVGMGNPNANQ